MVLIHDATHYTTIDAEYDSDATQFSGQDDDQPDDSHEIDGKRLEKWIPPLFYLAKSKHTMKH